MDLHFVLKPRGDRQGEIRRRSIREERWIRRKMRSHSVEEDRSKTGSNNNTEFRSKMGRRKGRRSEERRKDGERGGRERTGNLNMFITAGLTRPFRYSPGPDAPRFWVQSLHISSVSMWMRLLQKGKKEPPATLGCLTLLTSMEKFTKLFSGRTEMP